MKIKESEKRNKNLDLASELKQLCNMKVTVIPLEVGGVGTIPKGLVKRLENLEIRDHQTNSIIKISQNTEKSPGDLKRLAFIQTPVRNLQLTLM